ncbi:MAG: helix-hairpin-helix domain-containing protein [Chitinophagaceae bacterium]|nr:helix-hairpin-helix domain-containing protein [Chitinophagaceae bacterium]
MKKLLLICLILFSCSNLIAQEIPAVEQQIENSTEVNEAETEDDSYLQSLQHYLKYKLNLNRATEAELKEFPFLSPLQIAGFLNYRKLFGKFIDLYELQSVPLWDVATIQKILPYITVAGAVSIKQDFSTRFNKGEHSILSRISYVAEKAEGFRRKGDSTSSSFYPGSRERMLIRYKYQYGQLLQYGFTAEKDPGEQWFKGAQKNGFDFYSAHLFIRNTGIIKSLAVGDFTVNMGQGLIQWQSLAFKKNVDISNIKRQAAIIRPFNSTSEFFYNRGAGITLERKQFQFTAFASFRKVSGNIVTDTLQQEDYFSSLLTSGLHRTANEQADKKTVQMISYGSNLSYNKNNLHIGLNAVHFQFNRSFNKDNDPYNYFAFRGRALTNISADWSYTWRNIHWFGEAANHNAANYALISGLLMSVDPKVDLSFVYRNIEPAYQSIFGNAFTENTLPSNEKGLFAGIAIKPSVKWKIDAYTDMYRFPFLRFRVNAPSNGNDYLLQITHKPIKSVEIYTRFRTETKALNFAGTDPINVAEPVSVKRTNWRTQIQFKLNPVITLRQRLDWMWYKQQGLPSSSGFLAFFDVFYKPMLSAFSVNMRLQYFETDDFNSRIYAFENDVLYSFSIPAFSDKGYRYYVNLSYDLTKKISLWARWAQLIYRNRTMVGSGLDEIPGNRRSELKVQILWKL